MKVLLMVVVIGLLSCAAQALIMVGRGNAPVHDNNWPAGSLELANLKTRVGWWEGPPFGGGEWTFQYRGGAVAFQEALDLFGKIRAPELKLIVHEGRGQSPFLKDPKDPNADAGYDWSFTVWNPENWNNLYNNPQSTFSADDPSGGFRRTVAPPQMDVYVADDGLGIDWKQVKVPSSVMVKDERATSAGYAAADGSVVRGDVFDMSTSKPIAGAHIAVEKNDGKGKWDQAAQGDANADGHFEIKKAPSGNYRIIASGNGYVSRLVGYASLGDHTLREYTIQLIAPVTVSGQVLDTAGKPIAGANVRADNLIAVDGRGYVLPEMAQATTDAQGRFELANLPRGHLQLFAYDKTHHMLDVLKPYSAPARDLELRMTATGTIKGKVLHNGKAAKDAQVSVNPEGEQIGKWAGSMNANPDGTFQFDGVPPGTYFISADPGKAITGTDPNAKKIQVKAGETAEVELDR
jgi:uncharacterized GH25 family protein